MGPSPWLLRPDSSTAETLESYFNRSNEDVVVSDALLSEIGNYVRGPGNPLRWLDVGAGSGRKSVLLLSGSHDHPGLLEKYGGVEIDIVEPSMHWRSRYQERIFDAGFERPIRPYACTWEEFETPCRYDLISFIHSVYTMDIPSLGRSAGMLNPDGAACIVVEDAGNALYQIKSQMMPLVFGDRYTPARYAPGTVESVLQDAGMQVTVSDAAQEQRFSVDELLAGGTEASDSMRAFLLQVDLLDYHHLDPGIHLALLDAVRAHMHHDIATGEHYLKVPDRIIWATKD